MRMNQPGRPSIGRVLNATCYSGSGLVTLILGSGAGQILTGLAMCGYGLYVGSTRGRYWVSAATYLLPGFGLLWLIAK